MPITTGTVLGRYRLLERAGMGGMSEVWKAEDETLKRIVAIKVILGPVAQDPTFRERFLREARLVAGLEHPGVLPVYDYGSASVDGEDVSYLVMPLVAGGSLKGRIAGPVPPRARRLVARVHRERARPRARARASSTATSSPRTSSWTRRAGRSSRTSASRARRTRRPD